MSEQAIPSGQWIELSVEVDHEAVESVVELFSRYGYNEGVVIEEPFTQDLDGDNSIGQGIDPSKDPSECS